MLEVVIIIRLLYVHITTEEEGAVYIFNVCFAAVVVVDSLLSIFFPISSTI